MAGDFKELRVWQKAHKLTIEVYHFSRSFPQSEIYGLTSQIRRAAVSVEANIAEGHGRYHYADEINFFIISRASCSEVQTLLLVVRDLNYLEQKTSERIIEEYETLSRQINSYIKVKRGKLLKTK